MIDVVRARGGDEPSARLRAATRAEPTYPEVGGSLGTPPGGYRHVLRSADVGTGSAVFDRAAQRLLTWEVHRRARLGVDASAPSATPGSTVVLRVGAGPLRVFAPCRVVAVLDEPRRQGFAYGTLPGHPEVGGELFVVTHDDDDRVRLRIAAFSRPATWWVRPGGPVSWRVQDRVTDRYVAAAISLATG